MSAAGRSGPGAAIVIALAALALPAAAGAQGVRIGGASSARYVELRPMKVDSVPGADSPDSSLYRRLPDGTIARCIAGFCRFLSAESVSGVLALLQDVDVTAWGLGEGVSVRAEFRVREAAGGGRQLWPQATQRFDALAAYAEIDRDRYRARLGRQWHSSGLGFRSFDGAAAEVRVREGVTVEGYAGWSLLQGLQQPVTSSALAAVEDLPPDERGVLTGGSVRWRPGGRGALRVQYEREIRQDRAALYAERVAADGELRLRRVNVSGAIARDLATGAFNEVRLRAAGPVVRGLELSVEGWHHTPWFPLWTIWGAFSPVGFDEARTDVRWLSPREGIVLGAHAARRQYQAANAGIASLPLRDDGWRLGGSGAFRVTDQWLVNGGYEIDVGAGATRTDGDAAIRWQPSERISIAAQGTAFENIYEYRVGSGRVLGGGGDLSIALRPDLRLSADVMVYRQTGKDAPQRTAWNQRRASLRLEWSLGGEPGAVRARGVGATR